MMMRAWQCGEKGMRAILPGLATTAAGALLAMFLAVFDARGNEPQEPLPITLNVTPALVWVGRSVSLSGTSVAATSGAAVTLKVRPPGGAAVPPSLTAPIGADGTFQTSFQPRAAGRYEVDAMASDGRGIAVGHFRAENPSSLSEESTQALVQVTADADQILSAALQKIAAVPPSPARDDAVKQLTDVELQARALKATAADAATSMALLLKLTAPLPLDDRLNEARDRLLAGIAAAEASHEAAQQQLARVTQADAICDNLEVVTEGIKWTGVMLNVASGKLADLAIGFAQDVVGSLLGTGVQKASGSDGAGFVAGEIGQNTDLAANETILIKTFEQGGQDVARLQHLKVNAGAVVGILNDFVGKKVDLTMQQYCVQFTGPVKAHLHATFYHERQKWWEYSFDLTAQLTLHYPRNAQGDTVALKGRIEGFGNNFKLWENALSVLYPGLMSSAVQRRFVIMPLAPGKTGAGVGPQYSVEGSVFGGLVTPNSFFFEVTGTATEDMLRLNVGAVRTDMNPKARVVVVVVPALTAGFPAIYGYSLPYKDAHFVFERTANTYEIPLKQRGKAMVGQQHFDNKSDRDEAKGEYTVDITACNPGC